MVKLSEVVDKARTELQDQLDAITVDNDDFSELTTAFDKLSETADRYAIRFDDAGKRLEADDEELEKEGSEESEKEESEDEDSEKDAAKAKRSSRSSRAKK